MGYLPQVTCQSVHVAAHALAQRVGLRGPSQPSDIHSSGTCRPLVGRCVAGGRHAVLSSGHEMRIGHQAVT